MIACLTKSGLKFQACVIDSCWEFFGQIFFGKYKLNINKSRYLTGRWRLMNTKMNPTVKHASTKSVLKPQDPRIVDENFITDRHTQC